MGGPKCCSILAYPIALDSLGFQHPQDAGGLWIDSEHAVRDKHVCHCGLCNWIAWLIVVGCATRIQEPSYQTTKKKKSEDKDHRLGDHCWQMCGACHNQ
jgi:hypothetical protein